MAETFVGFLFAGDSLGFLAGGDESAAAGRFLAVLPSRLKELDFAGGDNLGRVICRAKGP